MNQDDKGLIWKLPELRIKDFGRIGPSFGIGVGCGAGFGAGFLGGIGFGPGIPGLQFGFGLGAGCGVGIGFGYGLGKGVAHDEYGRHSNIGKLFNGPNDFSSMDDINALVDEVILSSKKIMAATTRELDKWRK